LTGSLVHIRGVSNKTSQQASCHEEKAPSPGLTWKQLNQLLGGRMGRLSRTADPTGEVPGRANWIGDARSSEVVWCIWSVHEAMLRRKLLHPNQDWPRSGCVTQITQAYRLPPHCRLSTHRCRCGGHQVRSDRLCPISVVTLSNNETSEECSISLLLFFLLVTWCC
jgi:hypothetical protein